MQISKIPSVSYNNRMAQKEQKNPSFGKLIIGDGVSTELIGELAHNPEIKNLVKLFDSIGANLKATMYRTAEDSCAHTRDGVHFLLVDQKMYKRSRDCATRLAIDGYDENEVLAKIKNLPAGTAIENFNNYYNKYFYPKDFKSKTQRKLDPEYIDRQKALEEVRDFNRTLRRNEVEQKKKSFWEKLSDLF